MIVLSGTIGAGKTTLAEMLGKHLNSKVFYESVDDNPILPLFYKDQKKYAFLLQVYFLNRRLEDIKAASDNKFNIMDRSIFEDRLFFQMMSDQGTATATEVEIYQSLLANMMEKIGEAPGKDPDLLIYIHVSFETMLKRIKMRGREYEQVENESYLYDYYKELNSRYDDWYQSYDRGPKMEIDGDKYDFVADQAAAEQVLQMVDAKLTELNIL